MSIRDKKNNNIIGYIMKVMIMIRGITPLLPRNSNRLCNNNLNNSNILLPTDQQNPVAAILSSSNFH
jgi:hypothetical protein